MGDDFKIFAGFLFGFFAALATRIWQSRIDEHAQRYDDIRNAILQAADISTNYWLKSGELTDRQAEARLVGIFLLINGLAVELANAAGDNHRVHAERLVIFNDYTTGGEWYEMDDRDVHFARAKSVQTEAARLILYFQAYRRRRLTIYRSIKIGLFRIRPLV